MSGVTAEGGSGGARRVTVEDRQKVLSVSDELLEKLEVAGLAALKLDWEAYVFSRCVFSR